MGLSLVGGQLIEDFNYGYPYDKILSDSAPEFEYSGNARTHSGLLKSSWYARKSFTLHYQNHKLEPKNYDVGLHGGAHDNNYHYLLFPILQWNQVQVLTLKLYLSSAGTLTFDKGFDGFHKDEFYVVVNNHTRHATTHTAGHGWTTYSLSIGHGWNTIQFVLKTAKYVPPTTRGGSSVSHKPPNLPRYLRLTQITVSHVQRLVDAPHAYVKMQASASMGATGHIAAYANANLTTYSSLFDGFVSGGVYMTAQTSFITDWLTERDEGKAEMQVESNLTCNASINQNHEATDGGVEMGTSGELSVFVPIDTAQTIADRIKPLNTTYFDYSVIPVVIGGQLTMPTYRNTQTSSISTAGGFITVNPDRTTDLPNLQTLRWQAVDAPGADDAPINLWPEHYNSANPAWHSTGVYQPTVHPHEHFAKEGVNLITYSRVVHTWWNYAQHMWIDLGSVPSNYTWQFVLITHPMNKYQSQYILDNGAAPPADYTDQLEGESPVWWNEGITGTCGMGTYTGGLRLWDAAHGKSVWKKAPVVTTRPQVLTIVYGDNTVSGGGVTMYQHGYRLNTRNNVHVPVSTDSRFVFGRWKGAIDRDRASHLSIIEIAYYDHALSSAQVLANANHLMGVYQFSRYK